MSARRTIEAIISGWASENGVSAPTDLLIEVVQENISAALGSGPARREIYDAIDAERASMEAKHGSHSPADPSVSLDTKLAILTEELGEAAKEVNEIRATDNGDFAPWDAKAERERRRVLLRAELVQVAAGAVAWLESL